MGMPFQIFLGGEMYHCRTTVKNHLKLTLVGSSTRFRLLFINLVFWGVLTGDAGSFLMNWDKPKSTRRNLIKEKIHK